MSTQTDKTFTNSDWKFRTFSMFGRMAIIVSVVILLLYFLPSLDDASRQSIPIGVALLVIVIGGFVFFRLWLLMDKEIQSKYVILPGKIIVVDRRNRIIRFLEKEGCFPGVYLCVEKKTAYLICSDFNARMGFPNEVVAKEFVSDLKIIWRIPELTREEFAKNGKRHYLSLYDIRSQRQPDQGR